MKQPDDIFSQMLPFWEHLTPQEQMALREASVPSTLPKGTITHRADQDCKGILLLLSGQLRAFLLSEEGREVTLYRAREGETCVLSSSCLMDAIVFDVLIEAIEETHVITLPVTALSPLAQQRPEIELFLYKTASERFFLYLLRPNGTETNAAPARRRVIEGSVSQISCLVKGV